MVHYFFSFVIRFFCLDERFKILLFLTLIEITNVSDAIYGNWSQKGFFLNIMVIIM